MQFWIFDNILMYCITECLILPVQTVQTGLLFRSTPVLGLQYTGMWWACRCCLDHPVSSSYLCLTTGAPRYILYCFMICTVDVPGNIHMTKHGVYTSECKCCNSHVVLVWHYLDDDIAVVGLKLLNLHQTLYMCQTSLTYTKNEYIDAQVPSFLDTHTSQSQPHEIDF